MIPGWFNSLRGVRIFGIKGDGVTPKELTKPDSDGNPALNVVVEILKSIFGNWPEYEWIPFLGVAGTAGDDVLYTNLEIETSQGFYVQNDSTFSIDVHVSMNTTVPSNQPAAMELLDDVSVGGTKSLTIPGNTIGVYRGRARAIRIDQVTTGAIAAGEVHGAFL